MGGPKDEENTDEDSAGPQKPTEVVDKIQRWRILLEAVDKLTGLVQTAANIVKVSTPVFKETAQAIAGISKCVTIVGSAFHVVVLFATKVEMGIEMKHGGDTFPRTSKTLEELHGAVV